MARGLCANVPPAKFFPSDGAGVELARTGLARLELGLDSPDGTALAPFWAAVLAVEAVPGTDDVVDPAGVLPLVWFQESGSEEPRQRWHPDVSVRVAAAAVRRSRGRGSGVLPDAVHSSVRPAPRSISIGGSGSGEVCPRPCDR